MNNPKKQEERSGCGRLILIFILIEVVLGVVGFLLETIIPGASEYLWNIVIFGGVAIFLIFAIVSEIF